MDLKVKNRMSKLLLNAEHRSMSFDENELSANRSRKLDNISGIERTESSIITSSRRGKLDLRTTKLTHISELNEDNIVLKNINTALSKSKKMILLTGAGISCNAGIPDFRSSDGLYNLVRNEYPNINISSGKEMFDISLFRDEVKIAVWATFMGKLYSSVQTAKPTKTHRFIAHLKNRNKMLRCYTQNIDGLEEALGLETSSNKEFKNGITNINTPPSPQKREKTEGFRNTWKNYDVVQLHGDLNSLACTRCFHVFEWSRSWTRSFKRGELPSCPNCEEAKLQRVSQGKRAIDNNGILRPNIVLYGENHPSGDIISQGVNFDISRGRPDFFIIMGTSLKVDGVKKLVKQVSKQVHERGGLVILVNKTTIGDSAWHGVIDYQISEDCDNWIDFLEDEIPDFFKSQKQVERERHLKREASLLRKKKASETKNQSDAKSLHTPPATPIREGIDGEDENITNDANFSSLKRRLIPEETTNSASNKKVRS